MMTKAARFMIAVVLLVVVTLASPLSAFAQDADQSWRQGFDPYQKQSWGDAERLFRRALEQGGEAFDRWGWLHMVLGIVLHNRNKNNEAVSELQTAKELVAEDSERFQVNHALAQVYLVRGNSGDYDRALAAENEASQYASGREMQGLIDRTLGFAYYFKEDWRNAASKLQTVTELRSSDPQVWSFLGRALFERGQPDQALEAFQKTLQLKSNDKQALVLSARLQLDKRNYQQAIRFAETAIRDYPQDLQVRGMLGRAYLGGRRYSDAILQFEQVVQTEGTSKGPAFYNLGQAYQAEENHAKAIENYTAALEHLSEGSGSRAECLYDLGFVYEAAGVYDDALQAFEASAALAGSEKLTEAIDRVKERIRRAKEQ